MPGSCGLIALAMIMNMHFFYWQMRARTAERFCFAGYYLCANEVKIGKPHDKAELAEQVAHFSRVKGVGVGHSW